MVILLSKIEFSDMGANGGKKLLSTILFSCFSGLVLLGQIQVKEQPEVSSLMDRFIKIGKEEPYVEGWRIKIISTTDRRELERTIQLFESKYPEIVYSRSHESPHYSLKVGAFETRFDVEPYLVMFKKDFPLTIPFRDKITKTELFNQSGF